MELFIKEAIIERKKGTAGGGDIFRLLEKAAVDHIHELGFGHDKLKASNAVWILANQRVEFFRAPQVGQNVRIATWPGRTRFTLFPRYYQIEDETGQILLKASAYWTLLDMGTRSILSPKKAGVAIDPAATGMEIPMAGHIPAADSPPLFHRRVTEKELDQNGHMNNAVYIDWITDALLITDLHLISEISILYKNELRLGDEAQIRVQRIGGNAPGSEDCNGKVLMTETCGDKILITGTCGEKTAFCAEVRVLDKNQSQQL